MKDFNFFQVESYDEKEKSNKKNYILATAGILVFFMVLTSGYKLIRTFKLNKEIKAMESYINSKENIEKLKEAERQQDKLKILEQYKQKVSPIADFIESSGNINSYLINNIYISIPKDVYFKSINMDNNNIQIQGQGSRREDIAEFQYNLKDTNLFKNIFVSNISQSEGGKYIFNLKCTLKDVGIDENK
ncbi:PilN domain-containing protein [Haloimpatiens lingqiaonensis]|uniref:PilN domain-containing protein n=1 Tax=Haloimpatiens lingqiaonensis TaxID=1380675 RepID=UPI001485622E|nr:PilN domain-containing protein [Haloimpatiens lingqiaonensis]